MFRSSSPLPNIPIYTLTWSVSDNFGGQTSAAIQRTSDFARAGRQKIEFLTLDPKTNPKLKSKELKSQGRLHKRVKIRNIWQDLRKTSDRNLQDLTGNISEQIAVPKSSFLEFKGQLFTEKTDKTHTLVQTDFFREDGSIFASDMLDTHLRGQSGGRLITLFTTLGLQLGQWSNMSEFYFSWLDLLTKGRDVVLITDSPGIGGRMRNYDRPNVVKAQVQHNSHLNDSAVTIDGPIDPRWKNIVVNSDKYDFLALLTERQRRDLTKTQLNPGNLVTIPNMFRGSLIKEPQLRPRTRGIQVGRLVHGKQVDHAIHAIAKIESASLDIYGGDSDNQTQDALERLTASLGVGDRVKLHGYASQANEYFRDASFSMLTSRAEGQPLVLLESMAAGCIPISYDVRYGPSDIITSGVDGFLVPPNDIDKLADTVEALIAMPEKELETMRRAAIDRARDFMPDRVVEKWGEAIKSALEKKSKRVEKYGDARLAQIQIGEESIDVEASITSLDSLKYWAAITWIGRSQVLYGRVLGQITIDGEYALVTASIPIARLASGAEEIFDIFVDVFPGGHPQRLRLSCADDSDLPQTQTIEPYCTENSNFSIRSKPTSK